jgi:Icc protein
MRMCRLAAALWTSLLVTFTGCLQPSEGRALRDLEVGIASGSGAQVHVRGGLAAVRKIQDGKLVLWAGAPSFEVSLTLDASASRTWEIELRNGVPGVELQVQAGDEQVTPVTASALAPTRTKWTFEVEPPVYLTARLSAPGQEEPGPFSFAVLSDVQSAVDRVQDVFSRVNEEPGLAFVWTTGDLTEQGTAEQMDRFQRELEALAIPMYGTLGNHDVFDSPTPWHGRFGRCNVHFRYRQVSFTAVDSASGTLDPLVYEWLDGWLDQGRGGTHVFATHIPILDPIGVRGGGFASRNEAAKLLSLLARGRVDATFYGHIHSYYVFENAGIPAYISGGGGALPERFDGIGRHFLVVDADAAAGVTSVRRVDVD